MKSLIEKVWRCEFLCTAIPFALWFLCFRYFFTGALWLQADAISYADHIGFYTDNLAKGVFPLWDPQWLYGAPYDFFLRRIGDVNPLLFLIVFLKWIGISSYSALMVFIGGCYFLAMWAFYLIARLLFTDRFSAFLAYILLLFSSWGSEIFYNYIIIIFVPIIWFFYFLLRFFRLPQKGPFLGMCFCVGLIVTTYIPFFFLTILFFFTALFIIFYWKEFVGAAGKALQFFQSNKIFTVLCIAFLIASVIPGLLFYKESKGGEFVLPDRHSGSASSSAVSVSMTAVTNGDIVSHGYFDRLFNDHQDIDMGDVYIPFIFFLILLCTIPAKANKLIFFLLFNILALSLITVTSVAGVHRFLYEHVIIFKFIRNIYYFFWLAMLPMGILLMTSAFKSLLALIDASSRRAGWVIYVICCHLLFIVFLYGQPSITWGAWVAVALSFVYFLVLICGRREISLPAGFILLLAAVFIQSFQVYKFLDDKLFQYNQVPPSGPVETLPKEKLLAIPSLKGTSLDPNNKNGVWENISSGRIAFKPREVLGERGIFLIAKADYNKIKPLTENFSAESRTHRLELYYSAKWFALLVDRLDPGILYDYISCPFVLYDNVYPYIENPEFLTTFQGKIARRENVAYVSKLESNQDDWQADSNAPAQADFDPVASGKLKLLYLDANTWKVRTHLDRRQFLVVNDNYNSGWHVFINGRPAHLFRSNVSFKGVWVPAGDSTIVFRFSTPLHYLMHILLMIFFAGIFVYLVGLLMKEKFLLHE